MSAWLRVPGVRSGRCPDDPGRWPRRPPLLSPPAAAWPAIPLAQARSGAPQRPYLNDW